MVTRIGNRVKFVILYYYKYHYILEGTSLSELWVGIGWVKIYAFVFLCKENEIRVNIVLQVCLHLSGWRQHLDSLPLLLLLTHFYHAVSVF